MNFVWFIVGGIATLGLAWIFAPIIFLLWMIWQEHLDNGAYERRQHKIREQRESFLKACRERKKGVNC